MKYSFQYRNIEPSTSPWKIIKFVPTAAAGHSCPAVSLFAARSCIKRANTTNGSYGFEYRLVDDTVWEKA